MQRTNAPVQLLMNEIQSRAANFNSKAFVVMDSAGNEIPSQYETGEGAESGYIEFVSDFKPNEKKVVTLRYSTEADSITHNYPMRTQAVLSKKVGGSWNNDEHLYEGGHFVDVTKVTVPEEHTDHTTYFRIEGPGWESDKVGYRLYLDHRNAIDIFGKKTTDMVLDSVGWDNFDSYHEMSDWGMDILNVGDAFGLGSVGLWKDGKPYKVADADDITCAITANGPVLSRITLNYNGWNVGNEKYNLTSNLTIRAGSRLTRHDVQISNNANFVCASLVKEANTQYIKSNAEGSEWQYIATYGTQDITGKKLGMVLFYRRADVSKIIENNKLDYFLVIKPDEGRASWYLGAAWVEEPGGVKNIDEFRNYLNVTLQQLDHPITSMITNS